MKLPGLLDMEDLVDYWDDPTFQGVLEGDDVYDEVMKKGDTEYIHFYIAVFDGKITDAKFTGEGSVLSQGLAAVISDSIVGLSASEAYKYDVFARLNFQIAMSRMECAHLPVRAARTAIAKAKAATERGTGSEDSGSDQDVP